MAYYACPQGHGDFNKDGVIDELDYELFTKGGCYLKSTKDHPECILYDLNGDGIVNTLDHSLFRQLYAGYDPICKVQLKEVPKKFPWGWVLGLGAVAGLLLISRRKKGRN